VVWTNVWVVVAVPVDVIVSIDVETDVNVKPDAGAFALLIAVEGDESMFVVLPMTAVSDGDGNSGSDAFETDVIDTPFME
jgi:hypothetical protein